MVLNRIFKTFSLKLGILILVSICSNEVNSLPVLDEIKTLNKDLFKLLDKQFEGPLGFSSEGLINLQTTIGYDDLREGSEQTIKSFFDRIQNLYSLPFNHPIIQETQNESEIYSGDCLAPNNCFTKKQGTNLCTVCEEDMSAATELIHFFQEANSSSELLDMGEKCKHVLNEYLFNYAITYTLIKKFPDFEYPSLIEVFPQWFVKKDEFDNINNEVDEKQRHKRQSGHTVRVRPSFSSGLAYFTEDYGYNSNHWNWHIIHRDDSNIDRRGELFYFMHHQMLARYDMERLSLGLRRVESTGPLNRRLEDGFSPNLNSFENGQEWSRRRGGIFPTNIRRNGRVVLNTEDIRRWHTRLTNAARAGFMRNTRNQQVRLSDDTDVNRGEKRGIDIFTGALEADRYITPNLNFYGSLHNQGHNIISALHDVDSRGTAPGVMASAAVSARDPVFYQWHKYVEEIIQEYKTTQSPYSIQRLQLTNVKLRDVQISLESNSVHNSEILDANRINDETELLTGCNTYRVDSSGGIDFGHRRGNIIIEFTHLDHLPFYFNIFVQNNDARRQRKTVTVRIFMAPILGANGRRLRLDEQQHLFIIIDKFRHTLNPGENVIRRLSTESSITSNCRNSRRDSQRVRHTGSGVFGGGHCGCGWPHHLLLPRGNTNGMKFQVFVLLTDGDQDYVRSSSNIKEFCGRSGEKYPDWQPMGYPFDRPFQYDSVDRLAENLDNAHVSKVSIRFTGRNILTASTC